MMAAISVSCFLYIFMLYGTFGYPSGAPPSRCETMGPSAHGGYAQTIDPPYTITLSSQFYNCGENLQVTLRGNTGLYRGFLCQARRNPNDYSTTVGTLTQFGTRVVMNQNCGDGRALTHSENGDKNTAEFTWTPFDDYGAVYFVCTIVQFKNIYWVKETLNSVMYSPLGSCIKIPTKNMQISTKSATSISATFLTTDSLKSGTTSATAHTTDSAEPETSSAGASTTDSTKSETLSASSDTTNSTKSETLSASSDTTNLTKSQTLSASSYTTESRTENQTNSRSSEVLLTSRHSASLYLYSNSLNIQPMSSLGTVEGMPSRKSKTSKNLCRNSAEYMRVHELLMLYLYYFLLCINCQIF